MAGLQGTLGDLGLLDRDQLVAEQGDRHVDARAGRAARCCCRSSTAAASTSSDSTRRRPLAELQTALIREPVITAKGSTTEWDFARFERDLQPARGTARARRRARPIASEEYEFISSQTVRDADVPGLGGSISTVPPISRNIWAVFAEAEHADPSRPLEVNVARCATTTTRTWATPPIRRSRCAGQPTKELLLRTAYGTGFRAPSLPELNTPAFFGATGGNYDDPVRCPQTGSPRDCNTQFTTKLGGNLDAQAREVQEPHGGHRLRADAAASRSAPTTSRSRSTT